MQHFRFPLLVQLPAVSKHQMLFRLYKTRVVRTTRVFLVSQQFITLR